MDDIVDVMMDAVEDWVVENREELVDRIGAAEGAAVVSGALYDRLAGALGRAVELSSRHAGEVELPRLPARAWMRGYSAEYAADAGGLVEVDLARAIYPWFLMNWRSGVTREHFAEGGGAGRWDAGDFNLVGEFDARQLRRYYDAAARVAEAQGYIWGGRGARRDRGEKGAGGR